MAYTLDGLNVQLVTVNARLAGQQIINRFWYRYTGPQPDPDVETSNVFLTQFRTAFRAQVLASFYSTYTVFSYEVKECDGAIAASPGPPIKYRASFDVNKLDTLLGAGPDVGALAPGAGTLWPAHEALRIKLNPTTRALGYQKGNYLRISAGFPDTLKDTANREKIQAGTAATYDGVFGGFVATAIFGNAAPIGNGWKPSAFSVPFLGRMSGAPTFWKPYQAASIILTASTNLFIGTQTTRRWTPQGTFRGR